MRNDEDDFWPTLSAAIQRLGLRRQVERLGPVYGPDKQALLASARVLVLPSISENFGNVVLEAMAAGCPVVTTEGVGAGEFVREGRAGIVCEFEVAALREALLQLWGDAGLRATMGSNAVRYVGSELTWTQVASRMAGCYEHVTSIVERPRSRR